MTPTNRAELVALMERAHDNGDPRREMHSVIDAMIKAGLAVVPVEVTDAIVAATDPAKSIAENWRLRVAAGRIDGGAA